jgi:hypothetical protein
MIAGTSHPGAICWDVLSFGDLHSLKDHRGLLALRVTLAPGQGPPSSGPWDPPPYAALTTPWPPSQEWVSSLPGCCDQEHAPNLA